MAVEPWWIGNEMAIDVTLTDPLNSDAPITDASPTMTLQTAAGVEVSGQTWPASMSHQGSGVYRGTGSKDVAAADQTA